MASLQNTASDFFLIVLHQICHARLVRRFVIDLVSMAKGLAFALDLRMSAA